MRRILRPREWVFVCLLLSGAAITSLHNYLLFHSLAELFSVVVASAVFVIGWNSRKFVETDFFLLLGIGYLPIAGLDLLHALAYSGMGVFPGSGPNLPTQLWIATRLLEGGVLVISPLFLNRRLDVRLWGGALAALVTLILALIAGGYFPDAYVVERGLTPFKIFCEYLVIASFLITLVSINRRRDAFGTNVLWQVNLFLASRVASEFAFTLYGSVSDLANMTGHLLKIFGFFVLYQAIVRTGIEQPQDLIFREMKEREQELIESGQLLRAVADSVSELIVILDGKGSVRYQSPSSVRILGVEPEGEIGKAGLSQIHPEDHERMRTLFAHPENFKQGTTYRQRHVAGGWRLMDLTGVRRIKRGEFEGVVFISRDLTEAARMERQIERSSRLASLGQLASAIAHEFNNVLMGAQVHVDLIRKAGTLNRAFEAADKIGIALARSKSISQGILRFARPVEVHIEAVDLRSWILAIADDLKGVFSGRTRLEIDAPDGPLIARADPDALYQALLNHLFGISETLENATAIRITVRAGDERDADAAYVENPEAFAVIEICDDGVPLPNELTEHVFDPDFTTRYGMEAGLSLSAVIQQVTAQNGRIHLEPGDDSGNCLLMFLPLEKSSTETE